MQRPTELERRGRTVEGWLKQLCDKFSLSRIEIIASNSGIIVRAIPGTFSPVVAARRDEAFAGCGSVSMQEAEEITRKALEPIAYGRGQNLGDALAEAEAVLKAHEPR